MVSWLSNLVSTERFEGLVERNAAFGFMVHRAQGRNIMNSANVEVCTHRPQSSSFLGITV